MNQHTIDEFETIAGYTVDEAISDGALIEVAPAEPEPAAEVVRPLSEISSLDGYLASFGKTLGKKAVTSLRPLHVPNVSPIQEMDDLLRDPFDCQRHVIAAGVQLLNANGSGFICGEMGTGKTLLAMSAVFKHAQQARSKGGSNGNFRCLILCPDHLIGKWKREIEETIPDAKVYYFGALSKDEANARKKDDGKTGQRPAINDLLNLLDRRDGNRWSKPNGAEYYVIGRNQGKWFPEWLGISDPYKGYSGKLVETPTSSRNIIVDQVLVKDENGNNVPDGNGGLKKKCVTDRVFSCPKCGNVIRDKKGVPVSASTLSKNKMTCEGRYLQQMSRDHGDKQNGLDVISPMPEKYKDRTNGVITIGKNKYKVMTCGEPLWWFTSKPYRFSLARLVQKKFRRFFKYLIIDECHEQQSDESAQSMAASKLIGSVDHVLALTGTLIGGYARNLYALVMRICPSTLVSEGFEWGKDIEFSRVYGRIDRIVTTKEEPGAARGVSKSVASMRRAKTGNAKERVVVRPGIMPTLFGRHMIGNTAFITLDEMAEGLPDMFEYIGGECPPPPSGPPEGASDEDRERYEAEIDRYERMKSFWVDTACVMAPNQKAEYDRIERTLDYAAKELLKRGSMKLLGTMLATTLGWPDFCHAEWAMDEEVAKAFKQAEEDPGNEQAPALLGQSFLKNFNYEFEADTETLILARTDTGETDRIPLKKDGGVYWLNVTFNGTKTKRLIYDTGASSVSLPWGMACDLGLSPKHSDEEVSVQVADGRIVKAKSKKIGSVKVGNFAVTGVECTIKMPGSQVHTVGYWDKPDSKDPKNWMGVVTPKPTGADTVYPKEQRLIDTCKLHKAAGHQVWVYCQMTGKRNVMPRLKEILGREGLKVGIMRSDDVEPKEREAWIAKHGREFDVMICFPKLVSTGLDLFSKVQGGHNYNCIIFYETGYSLNDMRQAARRAWRIGQPRDCYIYYMYYQGTMQHRAMSLMSKKMAAALALEGEFSEDGLAAMAGDGDEQMALAKSMSEKIDDIDMQRSWTKVKSVTDRRKPARKKPVEAIAVLASNAKPSPLDARSPEEQLMGSTILERQGEPVPDSATPDIRSLAERFAQSDEGMRAAAGAIAEREAADSTGDPEPTQEEALMTAAVGQWAKEDAELESMIIKEGEFTVEDIGNMPFPNPLGVAQPKPVVNLRLAEELLADAEDSFNRMLFSAELPGPLAAMCAENAALESTIVNDGKVEPKPKSERPKLKVHQPEPEPVNRVHAVFEDIVFDDVLIAKMMANLASHGMTLEDISG
jgi:clan AA aspartic protease (TIGR02281 family)